MLNLQNLYSVAESLDGLRYNFVTDSGVEYSAYFICMNSYGNMLNNTYMFNFERLHNIKTKSDPKIKHTICSILLSFFSNHNNAIIYICDSSDEREEMRNRVFSRWYKDMEIVNVERFNISTKTDYYKVFASLFICKDNPEIDSIVVAFKEIIQDISIIE